MVFSKDYYFFYFAMTLFMVFHRGMTTFKCVTIEKGKIEEKFASTFKNTLEILNSEDEPKKSCKSKIKFNKNSQYVRKYVEYAKKMYDLYEKNGTGKKLCALSAQMCFILPVNAMYVNATAGPTIEIDYPLKALKKPSLVDKIMDILVVMQCKIDIIVQKFERDTDGKFTGETTTTDDYIYFSIVPLNDKIYIFTRLTGRTPSNQVYLYAELSDE